MFYEKNTYQKKLPQSKDLNILHQAKEFKKQTSVAEKQYQKFDKVFEPNKKKEDKAKIKKTSC